MSGGVFRSSLKPCEPLTHSSGRPTIISNMFDIHHLKSEWLTFWINENDEDFVLKFYSDLQKLNIGIAENILVHST